MWFEKNREFWKLEKEYKVSLSLLFVCLFWNKNARVKRKRRGERILNGEGKWVVGLLRFAFGRKDRTTVNGNMACSAGMDAVSVSLLSLSSEPTYTVEATSSTRDSKNQIWIHTTYIHRREERLLSRACYAVLFLLVSIILGYSEFLFPHFCTVCREKSQKILIVASRILHFCTVIIWIPVRFRTLCSVIQTYRRRDGTKNVQSFF